MKTVKLFLGLFLVALAISCGSDDEGSNVIADPIIGNWKYIGDQIGVEFEPSGYQPCENDLINFKADGTYEVTYLYCDADPESYLGQWQKLNSANLYRIIEDGNTDDIEIIFSENNTKMSVIVTDLSTDVDAIVYQRQ